MSVRLMAMVWDLPMESHTQKLVLLALADLANHAGYCWPSVRYLADKCCLSKQGVCDQIEGLTKSGLLSVVRKGSAQKSTLYHLPMVATNEEWSDMHSKPASNQVGHTQDSASNGVDSSVQPDLLQRPTALVSASNGVGQIRYRSVNDPSYTQAGVIEVYEAYPLKVGKPDALRAISKAIKKHGFEHVLNRTKIYAETRRGQDPKFTPHPATFFNQERYNDDVETWKARAVVEPSKPQSLLSKNLTKINATVQRFA